MDGIVVDESMLPICVVRWSGRPTRQDFDEYLRRMTDMITAPVPPARVTIHDASGYVLTPATFRAETARWMAHYEEEIRRSALGIGFVIDSVMVRSVLGAVLWLQPLPVRHRIVRTRDDALSWANRLLVEGGVRKPREHLFRPRTP